MDGSGVLSLGGTCGVGVGGVLFGVAALDMGIGREYCGGSLWFLLCICKLKLYVGTCMSVCLSPADKAEVGASSSSVICKILHFQCLFVLLSEWCSSIFSRVHICFLLTVFYCKLIRIIFLSSHIFKILNKS